MSASVSVLPSPVCSVNGPPTSAVGLRAGVAAIQIPMPISAITAIATARARVGGRDRDDLRLDLAGLKDRSPSMGEPSIAASGRGGNR